MIPLDLLRGRYAWRTFRRPGYSCAENMIWKGHLYVGYAANKEEAQVARVPLSARSPKPGLSPRCEAMR